jgi:hypothetical protein
MQWQMLPPESPAYQTRTVSGGRTYSGTPGTPQLVPDFDGQQLQANGWTLVAPAGPTSARPTTAPGLYQAAANSKFFDTTLDSLIVFDGSVWRNPASGAAV